MKLFNKILSVLILTTITAQCAFSADVWLNDLRKMFLNNSAIIYEINIRTFGANDANKNGIIDFDEGEESGNFINAIPKLKELSQKGINTIHVMPINPTGKTKALGTAGSLYAASSYNTINPQLVSQTSSLSAKAQALKFVEEAHNKKIRVILDLPSCGSYDLYMQHPELFLKDKSGQAIVPADWTDVRLFNAGSETAVNSEVYNMYKEFVDLALYLGVDGIRADVPSIKPAKFWKDLIDYSRSKDPQFMWLAEASESLTEPIADGAIFTPYNKLLEAGFDGYYGSYFNIKNFKTGKELIDLIRNTIVNLNKYNEPKAVIGSFSTHDEMSPIVINGPALSDMIIWLNATLPVNSYFVDGFDTGDNYIYLYGNKEAGKTYTDDDTYFVHRGKIDIFNFSRQPGGNNSELLKDFIISNNIKRQFSKIINYGKFVPLKASANQVFAYAISYDNQSIIVAGNLDFRQKIETTVSIPKLSEKTTTIPIKIQDIPITERGNLKISLSPGEIIVLFLSDLEVK